MLGIGLDDLAYHRVTDNVFLQKLNRRHAFHANKDIPRFGKT
jgi:hypothetical protein